MVVWGDVDGGGGVGKQKKLGFFYPVAGIEL